MSDERLSDSYTGLPDWPLLGEISEIWPRCKLVGLKILVGIFAFFDLISSWLAVKNVFGLLALF